MICIVYIFVWWVVCLFVVVWLILNCSFGVGLWWGGFWVGGFVVLGCLLFGLDG